MPGSTGTSASSSGGVRPGRGEPVREATSLDIDINQSATLYDQNHQPRQHQQQSSSSQLNSSRPVAPSTAVPITSQHTFAYYPPSPPSTIASSPPESPGIELSTLQFDGEETIPEEDEEDENNNKNGVSGASQSSASGSMTTRHLTAAVAAMATTQGNVPQSQRASTSHHFSSGPTNRRQTGIRNPPPTMTNTQSRMPDTPGQTPDTMSPACSTASHHPTESAKRFFASTLDNFPTRKGSEHVVGKTEDAGVELVCPGWTGAVLDQSRLRSSIGSSRALYVLVPTDVRSESLREDVLSVLDLASETLNCEVVFLCLNKDGMEEEEWKSTLHGLCYVGGQVVATGANREKLTGCKVKEGLVLVAVEV